MLGTGLFAVVLATSSEAAAQNVPERPNFVVFASDNQGWHDIGYHNPEILTPNLDRLAAEGVRLNRFYVYPLCSPTRVGFISGRAPSRYGILGAIGYRSRQALPPENVTIADAMKSRGYRNAIIGKWHLGLHQEFGPLQYGFDYSYGHYHGQIDKLTHLYKNGDRTWHRNDVLMDEEGHATDLVEADAIRFIDRQPADRPFFLYVPFTAPHTPLQEEEKWIKPYEGRIAAESRRHYAASISHMDSSIGNIIKALERKGVRQQTMVVFFSDNGAVKELNQPELYGGRFPAYPVIGDNGPLRGWIGDVYDGCVRTPALVHWPGVLKPSVVDDVTCVLDWYPTLAHLAGVVPDAKLRLEGRNIWPLLEQQGKVEPIELYWKTGLYAAVRNGPWKLVVSRRTQKPDELFHLVDDPNEKRNVAKEHPDVVRRLRQRVEAQLALDGD